MDSASPPEPTSSGKWREGGNRRAERLEDLDLRGGVGDVILAAHDVGDGEFDIVHDRGQRVEEAAILADQHRIGEMGGVDLDIAADGVVPCHFRLR